MDLDVPNAAADMRIGDDEVDANRLDAQVDTAFDVPAELKRRDDRLTAMRGSKAVHARHKATRMRRERLLTRQSPVRTEVAAPIPTGS